MKTKAAVISAGLSILFVVVYSTTNWLSSLRTDVGTWYFDWERWIPFVPLMVVPYMSIDLFFVSAPFLIDNDRELQTFARRIAFAIGAAGICFLVMPLRLAVDRPALEGWLGAVFGWFFTMDKPFNLCPSLHIALRTLLAETYSRYTRGMWNIASHVWFSLVGLSTLLTYQHHVVDVAGGFVLAVICFYLFPLTAIRHPVSTNRSIGTGYAAVCVATTVMAAGLGPWGTWLLWPAAAAGISACGYFGVGPGIYRKTSGRLPLSSRLVLAPVLCGHLLSWWYYQRKCRAWDELRPHVWIGRWLTPSEALTAEEQGVRAVLDLTSELSAPPAFRSLHYLNVPILDLTAPTAEQLDQCLRFIDEQAPKGVVYIHCKAGYSRTAAVAASYLVAHQLAVSADDAMDQLRQVRPSIIIRGEAAQAIKSFAERRQASFPGTTAVPPQGNAPSGNDHERPAQSPC